MVITQEQLLDRLVELVQNSESVDIAIAWCTPCKALSIITSFGRKNPGRLRSVVGISGNATHPQALYALQKEGNLKISSGGPLFHPKLFLFSGKKSVTAWIGSANLTRCGFEQNTELVSEFSDNGLAASWFNKLWDSLDDDPSGIIEEYGRAWKPTASPQRGNVGTEGAPNEAEFQRAVNNVSDWASFVDALGYANKSWLEKLGVSVDGETTSWLNTITLGNEIMKRDSWEQLSVYDYRILMGIETRENDLLTGYGLLGSMIGAGYAKNVFNENSTKNINIRQDIRTAIQPVLQANRLTFDNAAVDFIRSIKKIRGFSGAIATRFLTLARPDLAVSVNKGSRDRLAALSGLPATSLSNAPSGPNATSYLDLLRFLETQPWYSNPTPQNTYQKTLANARAALLDCLVYRPTN